MKFFIYFILLSHLLPPAIPAATEAGEPQVRLGNLPEQHVWVGQQVLFQLTLSLTERPSGSPMFSVPDTPGGILMVVPESPIYGSEEYNNVAYTTWTYGFVFYPHRSGAHAIPPITVRVKQQQPDGSQHEFVINTKNFSIEAKLPSGAGGLATLITTSNLEVEETWRPERTEVRVGDAITRVIRLRAPGILGMGFPPLPEPAVKGVGIYPEQAVIKDEINRGEMMGERRETVVYICEQPGDITLPGITIPWFDPGAAELRHVILEPRRLKVLANPALAGSPEEAEMAGAEPGRDVPLWRILSGVALLIALAGALVRWRRPIQDWLLQQKKRGTSSEAFLHARLKAAVRSGDAKEVIKHAGPWLQRVCPPDKVRTLTEFSLRYGDGELQDNVAKLMAQCFGRNAGRMTGTSATRFQKGLARARQRCPGKSRKADGQLPPLNPSI